MSLKSFQRLNILQQNPSVTEQKFHSIVMLLKMLVELGHHQSHQLSQELQIFINIVVSGCTYKDSTLHESNKAPECFRFVLQLAQDGS